MRVNRDDGGLGPAKLCAHEGPRRHARAAASAAAPPQRPPWCTHCKGRRRSDRSALPQDGVPPSPTCPTRGRSASGPPPNGETACCVGVGRVEARTWRTGRKLATPFCQFYQTIRVFPDAIVCNNYGLDCCIGFGVDQLQYITVRANTQQLAVVRANTQQLAMLRCDTKRWRFLRVSIFIKNQTWPRDAVTEASTEGGGGATNPVQQQIGGCSRDGTKDWSLGPEISEDGGGAPDCFFKKVVSRFLFLFF